MIFYYLVALTPTLRERRVPYGIVYPGTVEPTEQDMARAQQTLAPKKAKAVFTAGRVTQVGFCLGGVTEKGPCTPTTALAYPLLCNACEHAYHGETPCPT
jgi:dienelactone hydrolase